MTNKRQAVTETVALGSHPLTVENLVEIALGATVEMDSVALGKVDEGRALIESLANDTVPHYGVSTGFGALATTFIPPDRRNQLQHSLIRSHAAGSGPEVEREVVRGLMALRLQTLLTGRTGVRREVCDLYAGMLNAGVTPVVHEYGSLGCSGDLAPLAHVALVAIGEGWARTASGEVVSGAQALQRAGLVPLELREKEGLALINGTDGMLAMLCLGLHRATALLACADLAAAMSIEGLMGTDRVFQPELHQLRPHPGQAESARTIAGILKDSPIVASHSGPEDGRVQDAYSLRCTPQVHGGARDTLSHAERVALTELASAIDNPVISPSGDLESNGNFHGAPVAYVLDFMAIVLADVASMSERRCDRFMDVARNNGLPPFLAHEVGVDSGLMIAQYTAAGLVSEMKRLAHPASVDSIPSSAMQEDHVSMGWHSGRKLLTAIDALTRVIAIEFLAASRALALRAPLTPSPVTSAVADHVNRVTGGPGPDRFVSGEIDAVVNLIESGGLKAVMTSVGKE